MKSDIEQERDRFSARRIVLIAVLSVVAGVLGVLVSRALDSPQASHAPERAPETIGMLEQSPIESTERGIAMREDQEASLRGYRWRDRDAGVAEIPIERAMQIIEERAP
ncbi:MAG: hypothetical protein ACRELY_22795 [Polyangiaceae bacterium]